MQIKDDNDSPVICESLEKAREWTKRLGYAEVQVVDDKLVVRKKGTENYGWIYFKRTSH